MLIILFGIMIAAAITGVIFWLCGWSTRNSDHLKIKFSDFRNWYAIAPTKWYVADVMNYVRKEGWYDTRAYHGSVSCYFGPIDYLRFVVWRWERRFYKAQQNTSQATEKLLLSVQNDIDAVMAQVQKDREDVMGIMKRVAENPNPPSPVEDFLKIWRNIKVH